MQLSFCNNRLGSLQRFHRRCPVAARRNLFILKASENGPAPWDNVSSDAAKDLSPLASEEVVLLLFQLELDTQLRRALNYEAYDVAQQVRKRRDEIDAASQRLLASKGDKSGSKGASQMAAMDLAAEGLRLRSEMQRAVEEERFGDAAKLRDQLKAIDEKMKGPSALASEWSDRPQTRFRLGQRVLHAKYGYRGVVVGWDYGCCETQEFAKSSGAASLPRGLSQPYYRLLADMRDLPERGDSPVTYVAEESLTAPEPPETWKGVHGSEGMHHPYLYLLFLGTDNSGDLIPCRPLRDKYGQKRRDVYPTEGRQGGPGEAEKPKA